MSILVVADHTNVVLMGATLNTITAALGLGSDIDVIVAGCGSDAAAKASIGIGRISSVGYSNHH